MRIGDVFVCGYCGKQVAIKWVLGTTHICLSPEERDKIDRIKADRRNS